MRHSSNAAPRDDLGPAWAPQRLLGAGTQSACDTVCQGLVFATPHLQDDPPAAAQKDVDLTRAPAAPPVAAAREASPPGFESAAKKEHLSEAEALRRHRQEVRARVCCASCTPTVALSCPCTFYLTHLLTCPRAVCAGQQSRQTRPSWTHPCPRLPLTRPNALPCALQEDEERSEMVQRLARMQPTIAWMSPVTNDATAPAEVASMAAPPAAGEESTEAAAAAARRQQVRQAGNHCGNRRCREGQASRCD